jgi:dTDP-4-amino-4,6-dideoxygalactose transaminase
VQNDAVLFWFYFGFIDEYLIFFSLLNSLLKIEKSKFFIFFHQLNFLKFEEILFMKKIQMVDLQSQYYKIKADVDNAVLNVLDSAAFINGPEVKSFQTELQQYLDVKHVIPCANGTDALQIALMALNLQEGDEVITADFTFAATVEVIHLLKLKSVLVDVDYDTFTIDTDKLKAAITPKTKAIIPVHLFGQCANMEEILKVAKDHNLHVIEDNAQAIGADFTFSDGSVKKSGTMGILGTTSFFPSKNLGCYGDGGAIFTNDDHLAHKLRGIVNHGMYERYYHDEVGVNSRLDSLQAAILRKKLPNLDGYNDARRKAADFYDEAFSTNKNILTPKRAKNSTHVFHQYTLRILNGKRNELQQFLTEKEIPAMIYYPVALRKQKAYFQESNDADFVNTDKLLDQVISLPMHTELDEEQLKYITDAVLEFFK